MGGRKLFDYQALNWAELAQRYIAGESGTALAKAVGAPDHKTIIKHLRPHVEAVGGEMRSQADANRLHRSRFALDNLTGRDVAGLHDPYLGGNR